MIIIQQYTLPTQSTIIFGEVRWMAAPRISGYWSEPDDRPQAEPTTAPMSAFVLCPYPAWLFQCQVESLYRMALEQAQTQIARERRMRWTSFSVN